MNLAAMLQPSAPARLRSAPVAAPLSLNAVLVVLLLLAGLPLLARALFQSTAGAPPAQELQLLVGQGGQFRLDGRMLDRAQLHQALRQAQERSPGVRLQIATADASDNHGLVGALALAEHAGVRNIGSQVR